MRAVVSFLPLFLLAAPFVAADDDRVAIWDTATPSAQPLTRDALKDRDGWQQIAAGETRGAFKGDLVADNGWTMAVVRRQGAAVELYATRRNGPTPCASLLLLAAGGEPAAQFERAALLENTKAGICVELACKTAKGAACNVNLRLKRGEPAVELEPGPGASGLRVACPTRFVVLPDFFADDIVLDARRMPLPVAELPSENFYLHLANDGGCIVMCVFENRSQDVKATLVGDGDQRLVSSSDVAFGAAGADAGRKVWVAPLEAKNIWHATEVKAEDAGKVRRLDWRMPFVAQWRMDFSRPDGLTESWEMLLQEHENDPYVKPSWFGMGPDRVKPDRKRWTTVLGNFNYPCWSDPERDGYIEPLKHRALSFRGPAVLYPINRVKETPLDAFTVVDLVRACLGVGPCEYILDVKNQKREYCGRATCACRDALQEIYGARKQKEQHKEVEKVLQDAVVFVKHIRGRIERYVEFGHALRGYLAEQKKARPDLAAFIDEMDAITREIDTRVAARREKIKTPEHVIAMNDEFRKNVMDYDGADALERCKAYTKALVEIGDNQDELSGECRWVVKRLRQKAGLALAEHPRAEPIAAEIRKRTQEAMRNPASHEGARH